MFASVTDDPWIFVLVILAILAIIFFIFGRGRIGR